MKLKLIPENTIVTLPNNSKLLVIKYYNNKKIHVKFLDGFGYECYCERKQLYQCLRNPYTRTVFNLGYLGEGEYKVNHESGKTKAFTKWYDMFTRCYSDAPLVKSKTYKGCTVCAEWHNFQNFAKWFYNRTEIEQNWHLDKDLKFFGNREYSPTNCVMLPNELNSCFKTRVNKYGHSGVKETESGNWEVYTTDPRTSRPVSKGTFKNLDDALLVFKEYKEAFVKHRAEEWKHVLPEETYDLLINWEYVIDEKCLHVSG